MLGVGSGVRVSWQSTSRRAGCGDGDSPVSQDGSGKAGGSINL